LYILKIALDFSGRVSIVGGMDSRERIVELVWGSIFDNFSTVYFTEDIGKGVYGFGIPIGEWERVSRRVVSSWSDAGIMEHALNELNG
jgi:hypothetical protein